MSDLPKKPSITSTRARAKLWDSGYREIGVIMVHPITGRRVTVDFNGNVQDWVTDELGIMAPPDDTDSDQLSEPGFVEVVYIEPSGRSRKTGVGYTGSSWSRTRQFFLAAKAKASSTDSAEFLCDLHHPVNGLIDTVGLDRANVEALFGTETLTEEEYVRHFGVQDEKRRSRRHRPPQNQA